MQLFFSKVLNYHETTTNMEYFSVDDLEPFPEDIIEKKYNFYINKIYILNVNAFEVYLNS